ncbi:quinon protein alcohol dehydrogenase-like superfamily, partial [Baffinella frigidus]
MLEEATGALGVLAVGTLDGGVELYDAGTLEELWGQDGPRAHAEGTMGVALSPGGATLASVSADLTCKLFNSCTGELRRTMAGHDGKASCRCAMVPLPRGGGECDQVHEQCPVCGHADAVFAASFSPAGRRLATCSRDGTARVWS